MSAQSPSQPTAVRDPRATTIASADLDDAGAHLCIAWEDGHETRLPLRLLRERCPCATCRALREQRAAQEAAPADPFRVLDRRNAGLSTVMVGVEQVGTYALRFIWDDGHSTGIYTYEYLRELCPCPHCAADRSA